MALDRVPDEPLPWLHGVARKALANQRRALRRRQEAERPLAAHDAAAPVRDLHLRAVLYRIG